MALSVVTVASGGLAVVDVTATTPKLGLPVTEATRGIPVTKVTAPKPGLAVVYGTFVDWPSAAPVVQGTWDPATAHNVTLSGGNLVATSTINSNSDQGVRGVPTMAYSTGKYYFETTLTTVVVDPNGGVGIATAASTYTAMGANATTGSEMFNTSGNIYASGANTGIALGGRASGNIIGVAVDFDNKKIWYRVAPAGNWNNSGTADPATNVGGITIPAGSLAPICTFSNSGLVFTTNFGASAFSGAKPSGFNNWVA